MAPLLGLSLCLLLAVLSLALDFLDTEDTGELKLRGIYPNDEPFRTPSKRNNKKEAAHVDFLLFTRKNPTTPELISTNGKMYSKTNPQLPTKVVIHGWLGNSGQWYSAEMKEALLKHLDVNVVVVDWSKHGSSSKNYVSASNQVEKVGALVAEFLDQLAREAKVPPSKVHLMGHSLGAHVSGVAGLELKSGKLDRITGFDPAGVFYKENTNKRLKPESAAFVDVIHTCTNKLGHDMSMGHVDFYPNGGKSAQPGCGQDVIGTCSHSRAYEYYEESLTKTAGFPAARCDSWDKFNKNECDFKVINYIGEKTNRKLQGKFYLKTSDKPPFSLGLTWL